MTTTKNTTRVNLHLPKPIHERLHRWCRREGLTLQDGLTQIVDQWTKFPANATATPVARPDTSGMFRQSSPEPEPKRALGPFDVCRHCFGSWEEGRNPNPPMCPHCGKDNTPFPTPVGAQSHEWQIPPDWVNIYGLTFDEQERYEDNGGLRYWPIDQAPAPEPFPDWWFEEHGPCEGQVNPQKIAPGVAH
jgi:hypothetical protein